MCSLKRLQNVVRICVVTLIAAGISTLSLAQSHNHAAVPQNQAQLQAQQQAAQGQKSGGLFSKIGDLFRGDDGDSKNTPPIAPANVGAQTMAQNAEQAQVPPQNQGTAITPPRPQSAGHSTGTYGAAATTQPRPVPSDSVAAAQATSTPTSRPTVTQSVANSSLSGQSSYAISGDPLTRMKLMQDKAGQIDLSAPSTGSRSVSTRGTSGPPTPPPSGSTERLTTADRGSRSLVTDSGERIASRNTGRYSLSTSTTDEAVEKAKEESRPAPRKIEMPPVEKASQPESEVDSHNFGLPIPSNTLGTQSKTEDEPIADRPTGRTIRAELPEPLPVAEPKLEPVSRRNDLVTNTPSIERPKPVERSDDLIRHQTPVLAIATKGPNRIIVGKKETYKFVVTNNSNAPAEEVVLNIELPRWAENTQAPTLTAGSTTLSPQNEEYGIFQWQVGRIEPNKSESLELHIVLREKRSFDLKFTSDFKQSASHAKIEVQQPILKMELEGPEEVLWGSEEKYNLRIRNVGNGDANDILVKLSAGGAIKGETTIDSLKIGNQHMIDVFVTAKEANELTINVQATGPYGLAEEMTKYLVVKRAELELDIDAPGMQYVGNTMEYVIIARNVGTADSQDSVVEAVLPPGVKYISSDKSGEFDAGTNRVRWNAGIIPVGAEFVSSVSCEAKREGECRLEAKITEKTGLVLVADAGTLVEAIADVTLEIEKPQGPIEVGMPTEYVVIVANRGTKAAESIDITAIFAEAIEPISVSGAKAKINLDRREVVFDRVPSLAANDTLRYRIKVTGLSAGNHKMHADLVCRSTETSLTSQQMSRFYQGRNSHTVVPQLRETHVAHSGPAFSMPGSEQQGTQRNTLSDEQQSPAPNVPLMTVPDMGTSNTAPTTLSPVPAPLTPSMTPVVPNAVPVTPIAPTSVTPVAPATPNPLSLGSPSNTTVPTASNGSVAGTPASAVPRGGLISSHMQAETVSQESVGKNEGTTSQIPASNFGQLPVSQPVRSLPRTGAGITSLSPPPIAPLNNLGETE